MSKNTDKSKANNEAPDSVAATASKKNKDNAGSKESRGENNTEWQNPDYSGPITIDQAEWRNKNLKLKTK